MREIHGMVKDGMEIKKEIKNKIMKRFKLYKHLNCVQMPLLSSKYIETSKIDTFVQITYYHPVLSSDYTLTSKILKLRTN